MVSSRSRGLEPVVSCPIVSWCKKVRKKIRSRETNHRIVARSVRHAPEHQVVRDVVECAEQTITIEVVAELNHDNDGDDGVTV